jgi:succinate-semialdehyde dehydrogenase/glutarate-semialdehyde dehydrogenase
MSASDVTSTDSRGIEAQAINSTPRSLFLAGEWRESSSHLTFPVENPATEEILCHIEDATPADGEAALTAACAVQQSWSATPPRERSEILRRAFELLTARVDELAVLLTLEMGKPLAEARTEVTYAAEFFRWFAEEAVRISGRWSVDPSGSGRLLTMQQPIGPCLLITPWNFPLAMGTRKIGPAIAAGCTMVVKPAKQTPLSMLALAAVLAEAGLPPGVLNVIPTSTAAKVTEPLLRDPRLRKVSFTGSTEVGRALMATSSQQLLRMSMELGGNAPFVVFEDADLDHAVGQAVIAKMRNIGQSCVAANRFHVQHTVAEVFAKTLAARLADLTVGSGMDDNVHVGPLIDETQRSTVAGLVKQGVEQGASVLTGGEYVGDRGYFYSPTVVSDVSPGMALLREEIFGPVAPITTFSDEAEAITSANASEYGLAAYVFTQDLGRALRVTEALNVGMVGLNRGVISNPAAPFGGVKASGYGREGGQEGIEEYLETKYVAVDL